MSTDDDSPLAFSELRALPAALRVPVWLGAAIAVASVAGLVQGFLSKGEPPGVRSLHATFLGAAYAYLTVSLVDFAEHYRLEKRLTGRYSTYQAIPLGESINHAATISVIAKTSCIRSPTSPRA